VLDSGTYRNWPVVESYGYFGSDATDPAELRRSARNDLERYATVRISEQTVEGVRSMAEGGYEVDTREGTVRCRSIVLATGVRDELPEVEGLNEHYGRSVFHCPHCDGYEARGKPVVVIGCDDGAINVAKQVSEWASRVTVVVRNTDEDRYPPPARIPGVEVRPKRAMRIVGSDQTVSAVELDDGQAVPADLIFFSTDPRPTNELARSLGCRLDDAGCVCVDENGMTTTVGVYAAGDVVPGRKIIQVAAASGAVAGIGCAEFLARTE
jgi:thioredoxin reductase